MWCSLSSSFHPSSLSPPFSSSLPPPSPNSQVRGWKQRLPLNTILRVLQVLVPQVEKLCTDK